MAEQSSIVQLQNIIGYRFENTEPLEQALLAAGADELDYDGNRELAQLGELMLTAVLKNIAFREKIPRRIGSILLYIINVY